MKEWTVQVIARHPFEARNVMSVVEQISETEKYNINAYHLSPKCGSLNAASKEVYNYESMACESGLLPNGERILGTISSNTIYVLFIVLGDSEEIEYNQCKGRDFNPSIAKAILSKVGQQNDGHIIMIKSVNSYYRIVDFYCKEGGFYSPRFTEYGARIDVISDHIAADGGTGRDQLIRLINEIIDKEN